jgi:peptidoglycan/xylan/chitin deacetylase (PgdA/CDA1 family)
MGPGTPVDEGHTTLEPRSIGAAGLLAPARRRRMASRHRRRRAAAGVCLLGLLVAVVALLTLGGGQLAPNSSPAAALAGLLRIDALIARGPGSAGARLLASQDLGIDRTLAYTPYVRVAGTQHREIALTFDDGPGPYTPQILDTLERDHAPATFFEIGFMERWFHASTARIVRDGFVIGDHTETHPAMSRLSAKLQRLQLLEQADAIGRGGAPFPRLFRPPDGSFDATTLALVRQYRMLMVLWTVDTNDYRRPGVEAIIRSAVSGARPGAIILLHDAGGNRSQTVAALPRIIAALRARGYTLVTVPQLLLDNPPPRDQNLALLPPGGA